LAAGLRLGWLLAVPVEPVSDSCRYDYFAQRIASGLGYTEGDGRPTAYWPVGPSFLFAGVYQLTGPEAPNRWLAVAVLNLVLGVGSVALTMYLGGRWLDPRAGFRAGLILACWPAHIQFTTVLSSELPMIFFMLAGLAAWFSGHTLAIRGVAAGVCFAAAAFMRPTVLLLPVVMVLADLAAGGLRARPALRLGVLAMLTMGACIAPWTMRNYQVFGAPVLISTNGGVNFWMGNNPQSRGFYMALPWDRFTGEVERNRGLKAEAIAYIWSDPVAFLKRTAIKAVRLHERESIGVSWNEPGLRRAIGQAAVAVGRPPGSVADRGVFALKLLSNLFWWLVLGLAGWRLVQMTLAGEWRMALLGPATLLWAYFTLLHAVTVIQDRYHLPATPAIAILGAAAIAGRVGARADRLARTAGVWRLGTGLPARSADSHVPAGAP
jgi:4-amino-4-deoxy-L-arabinose transferase-like glycosyltransferase